MVEWCVLGNLGVLIIIRASASQKCRIIADIWTKAERSSHVGSKCELEG